MLFKHAGTCTVWCLVPGLWTVHSQGTICLALRSAAMPRAQCGAQAPRHALPAARNLASTHCFPALTSTHSVLSMMSILRKSMAPSRARALGAVSARAFASDRAGIAGKDAAAEGYGSCLFYGDVAEHVRAAPRAARRRPARRAPTPRA